MSKQKLDTETRLRALELATEIAAEAAGNTNVIWMIEFQEELVERLYRKMIALLNEESSQDREGDAEAEDEDRRDEAKAGKEKKKRKMPA